MGEKYKGTLFFVPSPPTMYNYTSFVQKVKYYQRSVEEKTLRKPEKCERCGCTDERCLIWCATYKRTVITPKGFLPLTIKRVHCKACGKNFTYLPDFLVKYHRYPKEIISFVVKKKKDSTYEKIADELCQKYELEPAISTIKHWCKKFKQVRNL